MARSPREDDPVHAMPDPREVPRPWLASYPPGVPPTYRYADVPVTRFLEDAARDFPAVPATSFAGVTIDYAGLRTRVVRFAAGLRSSGVGAGDRVVVSCADLPAVPIALFATLRLGAVAVLADPATEDVAEVVARNGPAVIVGAPEVLDTVGADGDVPLVAVRAREWLAPTRRRLVALRNLWADRGRPGRPFDDLLEADVEIPPAAVAPDAPAVIVHERGTRVVHTHASLVAGAFQARLWIPDIQAGKERILLAAPATRAFGLTAGILAGALSAATLVFPRDRDPEAVLAAAEQGRPGLALLERGLVEETASDAGQLASLRAALVDGAVDAETRRRFEVLGAVRLRAVHAPAAAGFSLAAPVYGRTGPEGGLLPVTDTVAVVVGEEDPSRILAEGEGGRLALHGPQLSPGELGAGGWLLTSQRAVRHPEGWLELVPPVVGRSVAGGAA